MLTAKLPHLLLHVSRWCISASSENTGNSGDLLLCVLTRGVVKLAWILCCSHRRCRGGEDVPDEGWFLWAAGRNVLEPKWKARWCELSSFSAFHTNWDAAPEKSWAEYLKSMSFPANVLPSLSPSLICASLYNVTALNHNTTST